MPQYNSAAPILPGTGAAGIVLGTSIAELVASVPGFESWEDDSLPRLPADIARYRYRDVDVWGEHAQVTQVMVRADYRGALRDRLTLGMRLRDFEAVLGRVELLDLSLKFESEPGMSVEIEGRPGAFSQDSVVTAIYVF